MIVCLNVPFIHKLMSINYISPLCFKGQAAQDLFVQYCLNHKFCGYYIEIGSNDPININNTYLLETEYKWKGIMIEMNEAFEEQYKKYRKNSIHVLRDATTINYKELFQENQVPQNIDYLQIDLEVTNESTLKTLKLLSECMDRYKFAVVTFEHDIYRGDYYSTRQTSRDIFSKYGYVLVFPDVKHAGFQFEDWYVHPDLVDMAVVEKIKSDVSLNHYDIIHHISNARS